MQLLRLIEMALIFKKNIDIVDGSENLSEAGQQLEDNHQDNNTASLNKTRLEGKLVSKNIITLSKRIYLGLQFPCCPNI